MIRVIVPLEVNERLQQLVDALDTPTIEPEPERWRSWVQQATDLAAMRLESEFREAWRRHVEFEGLRRKLEGKAE